MLKKHRYTVLLLLMLCGTFQALAQLPMPENVCVGTQQRYWVVGTPGSTYTWMLDGVVQSSTGDSIDIIWTKIGKYKLEVQEHQDQCNGDVQTGIVNVYNQPQVFAGDQVPVCYSELVRLTSATAKNISSLQWTSDGDGIFTQPDSLKTVYVPGPDDLTKGFVNLTLTGKGMADNGTCISASSLLRATFMASPRLVVHNPAPVCQTETVDLSDPLITHGSDPMTFTWFKDSMATVTLPNYSAVDKAGTYYIEGTSLATGCQVVKPVNVTFIKPTVPSFSPIDDLCLNNPNPPILPPSSMNGGISGTWTPDKISTDQAGTFAYTFHPDKSPWCAIDTTIYVKVSSSIEPLFNSINVCQGDPAPPLPSISINGVLGTWDPAVISTTSIGSFTYNFTPDPGSCGNPAKLTVTISNKAQPQFSYSVLKLCRTDIPPALPTVTSGLKTVTGMWTPASISTDVAKTTVYVFDPDPGQCVKSGTIVVTVDPKQKPQFTPIGPLCFNSGNVTLPTISTNKISGTWSPSVISTVKSGTFIYQFTPDAAFCADTASMKIQVDDPIQVDISVPEQIKNYGGTARVAVTATGGSGIYTSGVDTFDVHSGWQTFTVTDDENCSGLNRIYIPEPQKLTVTARIMNPIKCLGGSARIEVNVTGGTPPYSPSPASGFKPYNPVKDSTFYYLIDASPNPYTFEVFDSKGDHGHSDPLLVTEPDPLKLTKDLSGTSNPTCRGENDGTAAVRASGAGGFYTYKWIRLPDDTLSQVSPKINGLEAGDYKVLVKESVCDKKDSLIISITDPPSVTLAALEINRQCSDATGAIEFNFTGVPDGKYTISYNGGEFDTVAVHNNQASVAAAERTYNNLQISVNGCTSAAGITAVINALPGPVLTAGDFVFTQPNCLNKGSVTFLNPEPNTVFLYSVDGNYQSTETFTGLDEGDHVLRIKDITSGCESNPVAIHINESPAVPPRPEVVVTHYPDCLDPTGDFMISTPLGANYLYSADGKNFQTSPEFKGYQPGYYSVQVQDLNGGCLSPDTSLFIPPVPSRPSSPIAKVTIQPDCAMNTGTIVVSSPLGATFRYHLNDLEYRESPVFSNLASGDYSLSVKDTTTGCESADTVLVVNPAPVVPDVPVCIGNLNECAESPVQTLDARSAIVPVIGEVVSWYDSPSGGNRILDPILNVIGSITYYAEASNGICVSATRQPVKLEIDPLPPKPVAEMSVVPSCNDSTGIIRVISPVEGTGFKYSIDGGTYQAAVKFSGLAQGNHVFRIENETTKCVSDTTVIRIPAVPPSPVVMVDSVANCTCFGGNGSIYFSFIDVPEGVFKISYASGTFPNVAVKNGFASVVAAAGTYANLQIEANGCTSLPGITATVEQPDPIVIIEKITEIDLKSQTRGSIGLSVSGGSGIYSYLWDTGDTVSALHELDKGSYTVTVTDSNGCPQSKTITIPAPNFPPVAVDDEFNIGCAMASGNLLDNDSDQEKDPFFIDTTPISGPHRGQVTINADGTFEYVGLPGYYGPDQFSYAIYDAKHYQGDTATVIIHVIADTDCDDIPDDVDPDADGDGILNRNEGGTTVDSDGDGLPNYLDIDSDNDGIPDNVEAQTTSTYIAPLNKDTSRNGIDDSYDPATGGTEIIPVDTDRDGIPDFIDTDTDNDHVPDYIEGDDADANGKPDFVITGKDSDADGLDDAFDSVDRFSGAVGNVTGTYSGMQDTDNDGIPDWRDNNDDGDNHLTIYEDLNSDGDYSNDDTNRNGIPEYLDPVRDCEMFVPNIFSPNGDNIHDYFVIYCIKHYPNAKIYVFDQMGNKIFEKAHYGNLEFWGTADRAWWNGKYEYHGISGNVRVPVGTYFYVLDLGNGEVKKSYVFISY